MEKEGKGRSQERAGDLKSRHSPTSHSAHSLRPSLQLQSNHCLPPLARLAHTQTHMQPRVQPTYGYVELVGGVCPDQARHDRLGRSIHTRLQREEADAHMSAGAAQAGTACCRRRADSLCALIPNNTTYKGLPGKWHSNMLTIVPVSSFRPTSTPPPQSGLHN
jgi:hypothetical protein